MRPYNIFGWAALAQESVSFVLVSCYLAKKHKKPATGSGDTARGGAARNRGSDSHRHKLAVVRSENKKNHKHVIATTGAATP
jgi:hypothetical protein